MSFAQSKDKNQTVFRRQSAVVPNDSVDLPNGEAVIYCNVAGTVAIRNRAGEDVVYNLLANQIAPCLAVRVLATGTSGSYIALF